MKSLVSFIFTDYVKRELIGTFFLILYISWDEEIDHHLEIIEKVARN